MRVGLLECDHVDQRNLGVAGDYRDMFARLFERVAPEIELLPYDVSGAGELPQDPGECDGWVCTGSRWSAYDDLDWIADLSGFVRDARGAGAPFVGICFGHQLLAHALGGEVRKADAGWGAGAHRVDFVRQEAWMDPPLDQATLLFMHQDQVHRIPDDGVVLGCTGHCEIASFRVGRTMLGIQAHPEFSNSYLAALLDARIRRIGPERVAEARASLDAPTDEDAVGRWIVNFLREAAR